MITDRLAVKVNYILNAHNNGKFDFDTIIHKKFFKLDQKHQRYGGNVKNFKIAKTRLNSSPTAVDVLLLIMLHIDENVEKKFQASNFNNNRKNPQ